MSLRKFLTFLTLICLLVATVLTGTVTSFISGIKFRSLGDYMVSPGEDSVHFVFKKMDGTPFTDHEFTLMRIFDWLGMALPILIFIGCIIAAAIIFYAVKLKKPIQLLTKCADNIAGNNLDFTLEYENKDEMGTLCATFEKMRTELLNNNKNMWRMMEERKRLNAAFAHDLRTPITVLKGYSEFLLKYVPQGKITEEKLISTVSYMADSTVRLEQYVNTMNQVQKLEEIEFLPKAINFLEFSGKLESELFILSKESNKTFEMSSQINQSILLFDEKIVLQVIENLFANAFHYAKSKIQFTQKSKSGFLIFEVSDDGKGFSQEELRMATQPFYKDKAETNSQHLGLGLNICKILCEKHGGSIQLENNEMGGAKVKVTFLCEDTVEK